MTFNHDYNGEIRKLNGDWYDGVIHLCYKSSFFNSLRRHIGYVTREALSLGEKVHLFVRKDCDLCDSLMSVEFQIPEFVNYHTGKVYIHDEPAVRENKEYMFHTWEKFKKLYDEAELTFIQELEETIAERNSHSDESGIGSSGSDESENEP